MQIHKLIQGSPEWRAYRSNHFNASDAPAMLGISPYKTRNELLHERFTGAAKEVDEATQALFDNGHRFEALARQLAEDIVGETLYPVTGSLGEFSASLDGATMSLDVIWEHKTLNNEIRAAESAAHLGLHLRVQMEQQLMVSGAGKCLFLASKWTDTGSLVESKHFWYESDPALRERIIAGWRQFQVDLAAYQPKEFAAKPQAEAIMALPALAIQIDGKVASSNLPVFKEKAEQFIASIKTDLLTDEDFANAEETVKFCEKAEKSLEQAKASALEQTADIAELMRTIDHISEQLRGKRLVLTRTIKDKKELIKADILNKAKQAFADYVARLEAEITPLRLVFQARDFAGAMKNKRTLATLQDAVDTELANAKITVNEVANSVRRRLAWYRANVGDYEALFADLQAVIQKPDEDFQLLVNTRISQHQAKEAERRAQAEAQAQATLPSAPADTPTQKTILTPAAAWPFPSERKQPPVAPTNTKPGASELVALISNGYGVPIKTATEWLLAAAKELQLVVA